MTTPTSEPVSLVGRRLPATVERTVHLITGEQPLPCPVEEWRDLLGVVERGVVELETSHGARLRLRTGDTFCLATVGAAVLRGLGPESAVVATVRRRKDRTSRSALPISQRHHHKEQIMKMKLELVPVPVTDVDRSLAFYAEQLGFALDVDVQPSEGMRVVQLTPPGSACSIVIGTGLQEISDMTAGSQKGLHLVVEDIAAARAELIGRGVEVGEIVDVGGGVRYAWFTDPDGNSLILQQMGWRTGEDF